MLFVLSAPSGTGKSTISKKLLSCNKGLHYCVSYTTRVPRKGEVRGKDYHFVSKEEFERMIKEERLVEWTYIYGNYYGTGKKELEEALLKGDVLLDLDVNGALKIKEKYDAVLIFLLPPTPSELQRRLKRRSTEDASVINERFSAAKEQIMHAEAFDYCVVNESLKKTVKTILSIIEAESQRTARQQKILNAFCNELSAIG